MMSSRSNPEGRNRADWPLLAILWLLVALMMLYAYRESIADFTLTDPDDSLRLVQVRDLLAGQAWYDHSQYRINPAEGGGDLHWSRFIDAQIAATIIAFQTLMPAAEAERWALVTYPLLLIGLLLIVFHRVLGHLGDTAFVRVGMLLAATTFSFLHYFVPMRIDHHNWQLLLSLMLLWMALGTGTVARGLVAALVVSLHVEISLEGLPYLVMFGGLFAYDWLRDPAQAPRLRGFALGLVFIPTLWVAAMRGWNAVTGIYCDAFSRPYLLGAAVTGALLLGLIRILPVRASILYRIGALALAGGVGALLFAASAPACLAGPFGNLSPLVREFWYEGISEGHPIWTQTLSSALSFGLLSLFGLIGIAWQVWRGGQAAYRDDWHRLLLVSLASSVLSVLVLRATSTTHAYVLAGYVPAVIAIFRWGRSHASALVRIPATAACVLATPIALSAAIVWVMSMVTADKSTDELARCIKRDQLTRLNKLPEGTIFASLDMSSGLLEATHHSVVATGHHRNHRAIHHVIAGFMAEPAAAEAMIRKSGATYVAVCPLIPELQNFARNAPKGLASALIDNKVPGWLAPEPAFTKTRLRIYRVLPAKPE
ncbi:MAG: hypothetical protein SFV20_03065 [Sphingopyxis sp.]|nr:hypothetical protein [Sphingopyxis sp.]